METDQVLLVSECNGRISKLHSKAYNRLKPVVAALNPIAAGAEMCRRFDAGLPAEQVFA